MAKTCRKKMVKNRGSEDEGFGEKKILQKAIEKEEGLKI